MVTTTLDLQVVSGMEAGTPDPQAPHPMLGYWNPPAAELRLTFSHFNGRLYIDIHISKHVYISIYICVYIYAHIYIYIIYRPKGLDVGAAINWCAFCGGPCNKCPTIWGLC